ncbi:hypothetical protein pb186bvf_017575 [Paramecium bursaria]
MYIPYSEPMNCIIAPQKGVGGVYLGNIESAGNGTLLGNYDIGAILSVMSTKDFTYGQHIAHKFIRADDADFVNLSKHFDEAFEFIDQNRKKTNVLVHCHAGVSRSATLLIAYMMQKYQITLNQAFQKVQRERRIINPNPGFMRQLKTLESKLFTRPSSVQRQSNYQSKPLYMEKSSERFYQPVHPAQSTKDLTMRTQNDFMRSSQDFMRTSQDFHRPQQDYIRSAQDLTRPQEYLRQGHFDRYHPRTPTYPYSPSMRNYSVQQHPLMMSQFRIAL